MANPIKDIAGNEAAAFSNVNVPASGGGTPSPNSHVTKRTMLGVG